MKIVITREEFIKLTQELDEQPELAGLEIQICPLAECPQEPCAAGVCAEILAREGAELMKEFNGD